jgi:hypothetical protein
MCKHSLIEGRCPRCDEEVDRLAVRRMPLRVADLAGLNATQRSDLTLLLLARAVAPLTR